MPSGARVSLYHDTRFTIDFASAQGVDDAVIAAPPRQKPDRDAANAAALQCCSYTITLIALLIDERRAATFSYFFLIRRNASIFIMLHFIAPTLRWRFT